MIFNVPGHIEMIRKGLKTQTRRINRGIYQVGRDYAVQSKRGTKAETDIRIVIDRIWEDLCVAVWEGGYVRKEYISVVDARAEGNYTAEEFEKVFQDLNPKWNGEKRWAFRFYIIEVQK